MQLDDAIDKRADVDGDGPRDACDSRGRRHVVGKLGEQTALRPSGKQVKCTVNGVARSDDQQAEDAIITPTAIVVVTTNCGIIACRATLSGD